jgi:hypothetical protein
LEKKEEKKHMDRESVAGGYLFFLSFLTFGKGEEKK